VGRSCQRGCSKPKRLRTEAFNTLIAHGQPLPQLFAPWTLLPIGCVAANYSGAARIWERQVLGPWLKLEGDTMANVEPAPWWRWKLVLERGPFGQIDGAPSAIWRRVAIQKRKVQEVHRAAVNLWAYFTAMKSRWQERAATTWIGTHLNCTPTPVGTVVGHV
jgi:hypothetical protein